MKHRHTNAFNKEICIKCGLTMQQQVNWPNRRCRPKYSKRQLKRMRERTVQ